MPSPRLTLVFLALAFAVGAADTASAQSAIKRLRAVPRMSLEERPVPSLSALISPKPEASAMAETWRVDLLRRGITSEKGLVRTTCDRALEAARLDARVLFCPEPVDASILIVPQPVDDPMIIPMDRSFPPRPMRR